MLSVSNPMILTEKDYCFLRRLKSLMEEQDLSIEFRQDVIKRLILRKNYGSYVESLFRMSRQGIRWRFQRIFNQIYPSAYVTICWIESNFGIHLRDRAISIAQERINLRRKTDESNTAVFGQPDNRKNTKW